VYTEGKVEATVETFKTSGKAYESEGALWSAYHGVSATQKTVSCANPTALYVLRADVAYHINKWQRGFKRAIDVQGSDHHRHRERVRVGLQNDRSGYSQGLSGIRPAQDGQSDARWREVKITKRAGNYVTLRDLIEQVAARRAFFLVSRRADSEFVFDIDLATLQERRDPVYYVQYAQCACRERAAPNYRRRGSFISAEAALADLTA